MNLPNKLTMLRIFLVPVFCILVMLQLLNGHYLYALLVFIIASVTDTLDGNIARKRNLVTSFGKFMDPIADKVLVVSAFIMFVKIGYCPAWVCILVVTRDFAVSGIRLVAASESGNVIDANIWGKIKTVFQMISIGIILLLADFSERCWIPDAFLSVLSDILMCIVAVLTVFSGAVYIIRNKHLINSYK